MHHRIAIWNIISIRVRIEEQVRRIEHPHSAPTPLDCSDDVQPVDECLMPVKNPISIGVFVDGNLVPSLEMMRRWRRHFVVDSSPIAVMAHGRQPCRRGVLEILHNPHSSPLIKIKEHRLGDERLRQDLLDF